MASMAVGPSNTATRPAARTADNSPSKVMPRQDPVAHQGPNARTHLGQLILAHQPDIWACADRTRDP